MKIKVLAHLDKWESELPDRIKATVYLLSHLHRKYPRYDVFGFYLYDAKILVHTPLSSVHPPKPVGPIKVANYGDRFGLALKWAHYNLEDLVEWELTEPDGVALAEYYKELIEGGFDFEGIWEEARRSIA